MNSPSAIRPRSNHGVFLLREYEARERGRTAPRLDGPEEPRLLDVRAAILGAVHVAVAAVVAGIREGRDLRGLQRAVKPPLDLAPDVRADLDDGTSPMNGSASISKIASFGHAGTHFEAGQTVPEPEVRAELAGRLPVARRAIARAGQGFVDERARVAQYRPGEGGRRWLLTARRSRRLHGR